MCIGPRLDLDLTWDLEWDLEWDLDLSLTKMKANHSPLYIFIPVQLLMN